MDQVRASGDAPPSRPAGGMGDPPAGVALFGAIATALFRRERTGRGGVVSTSLMANGVWANGLQVQAWLAGARFGPRPPREQALNPLSNVYRCGDDRWLSLLVLNERQWPALLQALELEPLTHDPRFAVGAARDAHAPELIATFDAAFARHPLATWRQRFDAAGITFGVVGTLAEIPDDPQMQAVGAIEAGAADGPAGVGSPVRIHGSRRAPPGAAPALGAHGEAILAEAGFDAVERAALQAAGAWRPGRAPCD
jgi:formyl-CoA transferase